MILLYFHTEDKKVQVTFQELHETKFDKVQAYFNDDIEAITLKCDQAIKVWRELVVGRKSKRITGISCVDTQDTSKRMLLLNNVEDE